jgi:serine-type D-Ala-D-Ala carboxypeptidase/endopeptidase (penicillin-binding protein 4)
VERHDLSRWWPWPIALSLVVVLAWMLRDDPRSSASPESRPPQWSWPAAAWSEARSADDLKALTSRVRAALGPFARAHGTKIGVVVLGPAPGEVLFEHEADGTFAPASNAKLFSTGAAWLALGREYRFATRLLTGGTIEDGTLDGDLIVVGSGDPGLSPRLHEGSAADPGPAFAAALQRAGVKTITGDLLLDDGLFDRQFQSPGWKAGQRMLAYQTEVSALLLNDACIRVLAVPGAQVGAPARVTWEPNCDAITVIPKVTTVARGQRAVISCMRSPNGNKVTVKGATNVGTAGEGGLCPVHDPTTVFGSVLLRCLALRGITVEGRLRIAPGAGAREGLAEIARAETPLLQSLLAANTDSHNLSADCLMKAVGARVGGEGSWAAGEMAVRGGLVAAGLDAENFEQHDGSGLSHDNRCSPRQVAGWLRYLLAAPGGAAFRATLATGGEGTLRRRLRPLKDRVRLKTGSLSGVRALSGYVEHPRWGTIIVSVLSRGVATRELDRIVEKLAALGG